jgi:hypothetical protein
MYNKVLMVAVAAFLAGGIAVASPATAQSVEQAAAICEDETGPRAIEFCTRLINVLTGPQFRAPNFQNLLAAVYSRRIRHYLGANNNPAACSDIHALLRLNVQLAPERRGGLIEAQRICRSNGL